jgi:hypothetical protein
MKIRSDEASSGSAAGTLREIRVGSLSVTRKGDLKSRKGHPDGRTAMAGQEDPGVAGGAVAAATRIPVRAASPSSPRIDAHFPA